MTTTVRQGQEDFPRLVELASHGEDVLITEDGRLKARITKADPVNPRTLAPSELQTWIAELAELRTRLVTGNDFPTSEQIIEEDRAER